MQEFLGIKSDMEKMLSISLIKLITTGTWNGRISTPLYGHENNKSTHYSGWCI